MRAVSAQLKSMLQQAIQVFESGNFDSHYYFDLEN